MTWMSILLYYNNYQKRNLLSVTVFKRYSRRKQTQNQYITKISKPNQKKPKKRLTTITIKIIKIIIITTQLYWLRSKLGKILLFLAWIVDCFQRYDDKYNKKYCIYTQGSNYDKTWNIYIHKEKKIQHSAIESISIIFLDDSIIKKLHMIIVLLKLLND